MQETKLDLKDVQNGAPDIELAIDRVGVSGLRYPIVVLDRQNNTQSKRQKHPENQKSQPSDRRTGNGLLHGIHPFYPRTKANAGETVSTQYVRRQRQQSCRPIWAP